MDCNQTIPGGFVFHGIIQVSWGQFHIFCGRDDIFWIYPPPPQPVTLANEGLGWDLLLNMFHNPAGDWHPGWGGGEPKIYLGGAFNHVTKPESNRNGKMSTLGL